MNVIVKDVNPAARYDISVAKDQLTIDQDHNIPSGMLLRIENKNLNFDTKKYDQVELGVYPDYIYFNHNGVDIYTPVKYLKNTMKNIIIGNYVIGYNGFKRHDGGFNYFVEVKLVDFNNHQERKDLMV